MDGYFVYFYSTKENDSKLSKAASTVVCRWTRKSDTNTVKLSNTSISVFYTKYQHMACLIRSENKNYSIEIAVDRTQG